MVIKSRTNIHRVNKSEVLQVGSRRGYVVTSRVCTTAITEWQETAHCCFRKSRDPCRRSSGRAGVRRRRPACSGCGGVSGTLESTRRCSAGEAARSCCSQPICRSPRDSALHRSPWSPAVDSFLPGHRFQQSRSSQKDFALKTTPTVHLFIKSKHL